jgi:hypothetical protein
MTTALSKRFGNTALRARGWAGALAVATGLIAAPLEAQTIGNGTLLVASPQLSKCSPYSLFPVAKKLSITALS